MDMMLAWLHEAGGLVCGQVHPLESARLPVCARCSGIYLAYAVALAGMLAGRGGRRAPDSLRPFWLAALLIAAAPLHAWFAPVTSVGWERMAAGAACGAGLSMLIGAGWPESVGAATVVFLAARFPYPPLLDGLAILTPVAMLAALAGPAVVLVETFRASRGGGGGRGAGTRGEKDHSTDGGVSRGPESRPGSGAP